MSGLGLGVRVKTDKPNEMVIPAGLPGDVSLREISVPPGASVLEALAAMERGEMGIIFVRGADGGILGTVTDGDLRRAIIAEGGLDGHNLSQIMNRDFAWVSHAEDRVQVLDMMLARQIEQVPVLDDRRCLVGLHTLRKLLGSTVRPNSAVIMAGGKGVRLQPFTAETPKPMVMVAGRPMLERLVLHLVGHGIRAVYLAVNHLAHVVEEHFGNGSNFGCEIFYLREQKPLGTAGALALLPIKPDAPLLVMNGDLVTQVDVGRFLDFHEEGDYVATMGVRPHKVSIPYGVTDVSADMVVRIREKPTEHFLVNAGVYVLSPEVLEYVRKDEEYLMTELFAECLHRGDPVGAFLIGEDWMDVGRPDDLLRAHGRYTERGDQ